MNHKAQEEDQNPPCATTQPMPASLAFLMARFMQKLPTTGPSRFLPFTRAVAAVSLSTTGSPSLAQIPDLMSFTYMSAGAGRGSREETAGQQRLLVDARKPQQEREQQSISGLEQKEENAAKRLLSHNATLVPVRTF